MVCSIIQGCCNSADSRFLKLLLNENFRGLYWLEMSFKSVACGVVECFHQKSFCLMCALKHRTRFLWSPVIAQHSPACVWMRVLLVHGKYFIFSEILAVLPMTVLPRHWPIFPFGNPCPEKVFEMLLSVMCMERRHSSSKSPYGERIKCPIRWV